MMKKILMKGIQLAILLLCGFQLLANDDFKGGVRGKVTTNDDTPAAFVTVTLKGIQKTTQTDRNGIFVIKNLQSGTYTIEISLINYNTLQQEVVVEDNQITEVSLQLNLSNKELEEVIVNTNAKHLNDLSSDYVSKMPLQNIENPQVYTTITKTLLADQQVYTIDDAMRNATGVQKMWEATGRGGDGGSYYNSRGFIFQSNFRNGFAGNVTSQIDASNLEKLEIIKGPSATLFGSALTSYGGLINRVTKKPYDHFGGEVTYAAGNYKFNRGSIDINTPIDAAKKLMFRINSAYNSENSFQDQGFTHAFSAAPSLLYKPNDRLSVLLDAELFYTKNVGKQLFFFYYPVAELGVSRAQDVKLDYKKTYMGKGFSQKSHSTNFFGQVNYKISNAFTSSTNLSLSNSFSNGSYPYFFLMPGADSITRADQSTKNSKAQIFEAQQNFIGDFKIGSLRNRVVFGLDFTYLNNDQHFFGLNAFDKVPINEPGYDYSGFNGDVLARIYANSGSQFTYPIIYKTNTYSAFISDVLNITDQLSLLAALRVDHYNNKGGSNGGSFEGYNQTAASPKFGIVYQPVKDKISLFANYQNSFSNRGAFSAYDPADADSMVTRFAKLEQANQIEGGVKLNIIENKLSATASYYYITVKDMLRTDPDPEAMRRFAQIQNGGQKSKGIEVEIVGTPITGLNVVAGFSYNDSEIEGAGAGDDGLRPTTASSSVNANWWISYKLPTGTLKGLNFGFGGNYADKNKIVNSPSQGIFTLPAYTLLNATAAYSFNKFKVGIGVDNLTNQKYWIGYTTMNPQKLRQVAGTIAYNF